MTKELFQKAENQQGYLKCGIMGFPGSGKSFTATEIALGLVRLTQDKKPVYALDTEKGFDYLVQKFDAAGVQLRVARTRAFVDLLAAVDEAEKNGSVLIIDSISHFWQDVQESYKKANQRTSLTMRDWMPIKSTWNRYTEKYLNSRLHIIMCGRAAETFDFFTDEDGKKQIEKTGTKMQAEKNLGYEPGLAIEMERITLGDFKVGKRNFTNRAHILKDRFDQIDGQYFDAPTFESFLPHINRLNLGVHEGLSGASSEALFNKSDRDWSEKMKQVAIFKEEIEGILTSYFPGRSTEDVKYKTDLLQEVYGTRSWKALDDYEPARLKEGILVLKAKSEAIKAQGVRPEEKKVAAGRK